MPLTKYDLDGNGQLVADTTAVVAHGESPSLLVEPVSSAPGNREFYVSVKTNETTSKVSQGVNLTANIPADGLGAGAPDLQAAQSFTFDTVIPVDHRGSSRMEPTPVLPLPHPV